MPLESSLTPLEVEANPGPTLGSRRQPPLRPRRPRWSRRLTFAGILIITVLAAVVAWIELFPPVLARAEEAYRRGELEPALHMARGYLEGRPGSRRANLVAARCLSRLGKPLEAEPLYQLVWPLDHEDSHVRAYALVLHNSRGPAILAYDELLRRWPDDVLALSRKAAVLISESRWNDAQDTAGRLARIPDGRVIGYTLAAVVHHNTGESEEAVEEFGRVLELDPELKQMPLKPRSMFWAEFAKCLLQIGRAEEAERHLHRALREGDDPTIADLLGQAYYLRGMLDDAGPCWKLAVQWDPTRAGTWWRLGKLELQRGRAAEAIEPLRRASEIDPRAAGPLYSLSLACRSLGRVEEAEQFRRKADDLRGKKNERPRADLDDALPGGEQSSPRKQAGQSWRARARSGGLPESTL